MVNHLRRIADEIDRLITIDVNGRGVIQHLYQSARARTGNSLVLAAAEALDKSVSYGSSVLVATGWPDRPWVTPKIGELDGPPGAALLARSLHRALGAVPIFLIEEELVPAMKATACAAGFAVLQPKEALDASRSAAPLHAASVLGFPRDSRSAAAESRRLISTYNARGVVVIEKGGSNEKGVIHNARGMDTTRYMAKVDELIKGARRAGIVSVGIGDGGNEIGMGLISEAVREHVPFGARCACPCEAGIAPVIGTDVLVTAGVSNWGAYGIAACLSVLKGNENLLHDEAMELRTLREAADAGLIDGNTGYVDPGADGVSANAHAAMITILRQLIRNALSPRGLALKPHASHSEWGERIET